MLFILMRDFTDSDQYACGLASFFCRNFANINEVSLLQIENVNGNASRITSESVCEVVMLIVICRDK